MLLAGVHFLPINTPGIQILDAATATLTYNTMTPWQFGCPGQLPGPPVAPITMETSPQYKTWKPMILWHGSHPALSGSEQAECQEDGSGAMEVPGTTPTGPMESPAMRCMWPWHGAGTLDYGIHLETTENPWGANIIPQGLSANMMAMVVWEVDTKTKYKISREQNMVPILWALKSIQVHLKCI